jgi:hypothetical protein
LNPLADTARIAAAIHQQSAGAISLPCRLSVIPAQAGIQQGLMLSIPACAGMAN